MLAHLRTLEACLDKVLKQMRHANSCVEDGLVAEMMKFLMDAASTTPLPSPVLMDINQTHTKPIPNRCQTDAHLRLFAASVTPSPLNACASSNLGSLFGQVPQSNEAWK